jgi:NADH-quinone oxidoreductase subunit B
VEIRRERLGGVPDGAGASGVSTGASGSGAGDAGADTESAGGESALGAGSAAAAIDGEALRVRRLNSRQLLRGGDLEGRTPPASMDGADLERYVQERVLTTTLEKAAAWARSNSFFPATFGLACCAIEMMSIVAARVDVARFGFEAFRASPRQADLLILSGRVSIKMAPVVRRIYDQMLEPKWAISMGACSSSGGMFSNYAVVQGADKFMPIDLHIPGCPPRPEAVLYGFIKLQRKIQGNPDPGWRQRYNAVGTEEWARGGPRSAPNSAEAAAYEATRELVRA